MKNFSETNGKFLKENLNIFQLVEHGVPTEETARAADLAGQLRGLLQRKASYLQKLEAEGKERKAAESEFNLLFDMLAFLESFNTVDHSFTRYIARHVNTSVYLLLSENYTLKKSLQQLIDVSEQQTNEAKTYIDMILKTAAK